MRLDSSPAGGFPMLFTIAGGGKSGGDPSIEVVHYDVCKMTDMAGKRHKSEEIITKLRQIDLLV
jgi:hypothetical protein